MVWGLPQDGEGGRSQDERFFEWKVRHFQRLNVVHAQPFLCVKSLAFFKVKCRAFSLWKMFNMAGTGSQDESFFGWKIWHFLRLNVVHTQRFFCVKSLAFSNDISFRKMFNVRGTFICSNILPPSRVGGALLVLNYPISNSWAILFSYGCFIANVSLWTIDFGLPALFSQKASPLPASPPEVGSPF